MLTIVEARREIDERRLSPTELVEAVLAAAERDALNAYIRLDPDGALEGARRAEAAIEDGTAGPLAGIPLCIKDVLHVAGVPTTAGTKGWVQEPTSDAVAVARLRRAGAVFVGKGNTSEFAFGIDGQNAHWGDCRNPHDPARMTGGSTSGPAAATAAGLAIAGIGTDTSGSLRAPASLCGLVAIRPTHGLVPTAGVVTLAWSYDTVGPITHTVADAALLLGLMAGGRPAGARGESLRGARVGVVEEFLGEGCSEVIANAVREAADAMRSAGADVSSVDLPGVERAGEIHRKIQFSEVAASHRPWLDDHRPHYQPDVRERIEVGEALPTDEYLEAQRERAVIREEIAWRMANLDALIAPATPVTAPLIGEEEVEVDGRPGPLRDVLLSFTVPPTQSGGPIAAVPLGESDGLPFGLQIMGRPGEDFETLGLAATFRRLWGFGVPEP